MPIDIIKPFLELFEKSGKATAVATNGADRVPHAADARHGVTSVAQGD
jgi:hypothetical protein